MLHVFDAGKNIQYLLKSDGMNLLNEDDAVKKEDKSKGTLWNTDGKKNSVMCYLKPCLMGESKNKVSKTF